MEKDHFGNTIIYVPRADSTNREMSRLLEKKSLPEGTVLWTDEQYLGKGLGNNSWNSEPGLNVTASFLLCPIFLDPGKQFNLNKVISLTVHEMISDILGWKCSINIKWPNDIIANGRKIAGILTENIIQDSIMQYSIAGIGLNVNQTIFPNYDMQPTSLKLLSGKDYEIKECIEALSSKLEKYYFALKKEDETTINDKYFNAMYKYKTLALYSSKGKTFEATITGVDIYGRLLLKLKNGIIKAYDLKEVQLLE